MEPLRQKGSSMASWSTFIFKSVLTIYSNIYLYNDIIESELQFSGIKTIKVLKGDNIKRQLINLH